MNRATTTPVIEIPDSQRDPITSEVIRHALHSVSEEMGETLVRTAYSPNIKERRDCSCAIFDASGRLVVLAEHIPIHLGSMQGFMEVLVNNLDDWSFKRGDILIANDPYAGGGSHLPDITMARPVFHGGNLVAFACNIAHWSDVGGREAGVGTAGDSTEILQEGLRIPPTRVVIDDEIVPDIVELIMINMRGRDERMGDFRAQVASLRLGERRVIELFDRFGPDAVHDSVSDAFAYSERRLRQAIATVPVGRYAFSDCLDDDGVGDDPLLIRIEVAVHHEPVPRLVFDFNGTASQARGGVNMVRQALVASVLYAVKAILDPGLPPNAGVARAIDIVAPVGSVVNASEPAAVGGRTDTCQRVVDVIMGAFHQATPGRVVAGSNGATTAVILSGTKRLSGRDFVYVEAIGGGAGASRDGDGQDGIQVHITNTSNLPVEVLEMEYPLRILSHRLEPDSGGPGMRRGGLAIVKEIEALEDVMFSAHSDRHVLSPWGLEGGGHGGRGAFTLVAGGKETRVRSKTSGQPMPRGAILRVRTAGGGGFGDPLSRPPGLVMEDVRLGKVSRSHARDAYGVVITAAGGLDEDATAALRERIKASRGA